jgi:hypothetical protein
MKTLRNFAMLTFAAGMLLSSCSKDNTDPSIKTLGVVIQATGKSFSLKSTGAAAGFSWDTSTMVVSKIEFEAEKFDSSALDGMTETSIEWRGPKKVDLFSVNTLVGSFDLQPGVYHEISLKVEGYQADAGSDPVFYLSGSFTDADGTVTPVVVSVDEDLELRVKQEGFQLDAISDYTSLVHVELDQLLSGISAADISGAARTGGKVIISASSNADLYSTIVDNFSSCGESHFSKGREYEAGDDHGSNSGNDSSSDANDDKGSY